MPWIYWLLIDVKTRWWWSDYSTSNVLEFSKKLFLFVKTKLIQRGFSDWKQVKTFIKLSRWNSAIKSAMYLLEVAKDIKFSFRKIIIDNFTKIFLKISFFWFRGLYRPIINHFWVRNVILRNIISKLEAICSAVSFLQDIFSLKYNKRPPWNCLYLYDIFADLENCHQFSFQRLGKCLI